jgi:hypothetical protein
MVAAVALLPGCASHSPVRSGEAQGYDILEPHNGSDRVQVAPILAEDRANYRSWALGDIRVRTADDAVTPETLAAVQEALRRAVARVSALSEAQTDVTDGRDLRVDVAITRIEEAAPGVNVMTTLIGVPVRNGSLAVEATVLDAASGRQVGLMLRADEGSILSLRGLGGSFRRSGHAVALTEAFADDLAAYISPFVDGTSR